MSHNNHHRLSAAGLLVTLGIIYGDIGTSPLYVMKAIMGHVPIQESTILGGISCVFWTLTLQTTLKYILLTLRADNNGEGGIFSLYTLVKRHKSWLIYIAMIGGATLLADGIITPPISVSSAVEGLRLVNPNISTDQTIAITIGIISVIFLFQRFGTSVVGKSFGPVMFIWFLMLGTLGMAQLFEDATILRAINPYYAYHLLTESPNSFLILGAVFLCTTGAEALYSDLGHCGKQNIQVSWGFVKLALLLNYFGQGAYLLNHQGEILTANPFYEIMPHWFLLIGIAIATMAAIIASQALITGSYTLVSEAIRLNLFPKVKVKFPTNFKGQIYIPLVNSALYLGCVFIILYFRESSAMEGAYGLAITITMIMTTLLLSFYLRFVKGWSKILVGLFLAIYIFVEGGFLLANLFKFMEGGYITLLISAFLFLLMFVVYAAHKIKTDYADLVSISKYRNDLVALSNDLTLPKFATHLVFMSKAMGDDTVESKILHSILEKRPKRADFYWFVNIEVTDEPYTLQYKVTTHYPNDVYRVKLRLGFRVQQRVNSYLRQIISDMVKNEEILLDENYHSYSKHKPYLGDFRFVIVEEELSYENDLPIGQQFVMNTYMIIKGLTASPERWFGLDESLITVEKIPLVIRRSIPPILKRIER
jgi:KUP system potassium uptake protein